MSDRSYMIEGLRGEIVGPARPISEPEVASFEDKEFVDERANRRGPLVWQPVPGEALEEVLYFNRESPHRKYGAGLLHPGGAFTAVTSVTATPDEVALKTTDTIGAEFDEDEVDTVNDSTGTTDEFADPDSPEALDDFEVTSQDVRNPSTIGISFCVQLCAEGKVIIRLPQTRRFTWQEETCSPFPLNGRYESCKRRWKDERGQSQEGQMWRRNTAVLPDCAIVIPRSELTHGKVIRRDVVMPEDSPLRLRVEVFPRYRSDDVWLLTVVLRNSTTSDVAQGAHESVLYQSYFEVSLVEGSIWKYPESQRPFNQLDSEEQSLALLYRESATWGIGHGCACGWEAEPGQTPEYLFADIFPAVELPSMTPDIVDAEGNRIELSMRALAALPEDGLGPTWESLDNLASEYASWIERGRHQAAESLDESLSDVAARHLDSCFESLERINTGISLLRHDRYVRQAFRLSNLAMLLQQISTKQLEKRPLDWDRDRHVVCPQGEHQSPWYIYENKSENNNLGYWRAFQVAFLLMSLEGVQNGTSPDREIVDLIWFPTGGGKTEAYLAVMSFYMFHQRLLIGDSEPEPRRDSTNVLMRYTLRMLTTQQFQRASSLICAMEYLRRNCSKHCIVEEILGQRFSLGLWVGRDGSPNKIDNALSELKSYRKGDIDGNPFILTECPWCRAQIGRFEGAKPTGFHKDRWWAARTKGITAIPDQGPLLHCTDEACPFGQESPHHWLPVEVIDERIYLVPPSMVIGTADKLAITAYRPDAGKLFGWELNEGQPQQYAFPPGIIIQDELHLISGPLGTVYALYEGVIERLCSFELDGNLIKPKLIASTATIRGADDQVKALYARLQTCLFPAPGLLMSDSFFGTYSRDSSGRLSKGRLYLGIHAHDYGSILTTQVRSFSSALFRPHTFVDSKRDPWWTALVFYNSLRELGGAKTLFDSDVRSRLKFIFNREGFPPNDRRNIRIVEELTSRLSQAEIVGMLDQLSISYNTDNNHVVDACLASNIIEVGVDIDRLSLMAVVGQPKTTATYIQVTGRVGRRWWERPGLIMMIYSPGKSRDRSHFEQFHSYHRRLYERVEPTSATPFALSSIQRALPGALITWARQQCDAHVQNVQAYTSVVNEAFQLLKDRCLVVQNQEDMQRSLDEMDRVLQELLRKWSQNPQEWEEFPQSVDGEYLMLWPGQYATALQRQRGVSVPSSMRQVDGSAELRIDQGYISS